jgi:DNA repair protein RadA/Sms
MPGMKIKIQYACQNCGHTSAKWLGRCPGCDSWNSFIEEQTGGSGASGAQEGSLAAVRDQFKTHRDEGLDSAGLHGALVTGVGPDWVPLEAPEGEATDGPNYMRRITTGISELDRALGGGLVPDSFTLLGGDPGIGKSTLLLQMAKGLTGAHASVKILYCSGEESIEQIRGRARRLGVQSRGQIFLAAETQLEKVFATVKELRPDIVVMDSLQTFSSGFLPSAPGSVTQVREVTARLMALAKSAGISVWLVGHVTKEGSIAGPKVFEHMFDNVLYFEV